MTSAITTATQGLLRASSRFEDAAGRIVSNGAYQSNKIQQTTSGIQTGASDALVQDGGRSVGVEPVNQRFSTDMTSALINMSEAEFSFAANARVVSKAYEMSDALLDATKPRR